MLFILFGATCCWAILLCFVVVLCRATKQADNDLVRAGPQERRKGERRRSDRAAAVLADRIWISTLGPPRQP